MLSRSNNGFYFKFSLGVGVSTNSYFHMGQKYLCSNEEMLAHCKQVFVCHANIVHFVNCDFVTFSETRSGILSILCIHLCYKNAIQGTEIEI